MYLMITRRALEVFNCNPVEPDDGFTYTHFTSVNCDGGLCRCWDPNHVQMFLVPFSILALLIITVGFPIMVSLFLYSLIVAVVVLTFFCSVCLFSQLFMLLRRKKNAIKEDQYLRALDIAPIQSTNPVAFFNRLKYHKMYYHFKPGKVYWITFIIARKGLVSTAGKLAQFFHCLVYLLDHNLTLFFFLFSGLLFRANPGFQLAFVLLVLFWAYVMQVKNNPFMSSVERTTVILEHQAKVKLGNPLHIKLASRIHLAREEEDKAKSKIRRGQLNARTFDGIMEKSANRSAAKEMKLNYFWNYNTVESVLLSCLIIVCVCGVMFESDR